MVSMQKNSIFFSRFQVSVTRESGCRRPGNQQFTKHITVSSTPSAGAPALGVLETRLNPDFPD
jgi:hypothetical protein